MSGGYAAPPSVGSWPDLLVGPILRRVTRQSVSVFAAFKRAATVQLFLYGPTSADDPPPSPATISYPIGVNLHVVVVTIALPQGKELLPNAWYAYDLVYDGTSVSNTLPELPYRDLRGAWRPGFYAPPYEAASLRIFHASCRLPHGDLPDALPGMSDVLESRAVDPAMYPHHLIFHGDQIYADDVAPSMLYLAQQVGGAALGWSRSEAIPTFDGELTASSRELRITARSPLLRVDGCITSTAAQCHLVTFAEFVGMYLLVWSPSLWPRLADGTITVPDPEIIFPLTDWQGDQFTVIRDGREQSFVLDRDMALKTYSRTAGKVAEFGRGTVRVRRALANVPVLMCFDDHEVTDDWLLHRRWRRHLADSALAERIVTNALSAYLVFQHLGNVLEQFAAHEVGSDVMATLVAWSAVMSFPGLAEALPPGELLGQGLGVHRMKGGVDQGPTIRWDFRVDYDSYQLAFLDTRTHRAYPTADEGAPALLSSEAMDQIPIPMTGKVTIIISPTPILGHWLLESVVQPSVKHFTNAAEADFEAWVFNSESYARVIRRLSQHERVYILSGDVHYSFGALGFYCDLDRNQSINCSTLVQLTSSALCNYNDKSVTLSLAASSQDIAVREFCAGLLQVLDLHPLKWAPLAVGVTASAPVLTAGALSAGAAIVLFEALRLLGERTWKDGLVIVLLRDGRTDTQRLRDGGWFDPQPPIDPVDTVGQVKRDADRRFGRGQLEISRTVVGVSAFCELLFTSTGVSHRVFFDHKALISPYIPQPYTRVDIAF